MSNEISQWKTRWENADTGWDRGNSDDLLFSRWREVKSLIPQRGQKPLSCFVPLCGHSRSVGFLASKKFQVTALDAVPEALEKLKSRTSRLYNKGVLKNINFVLEDIFKFAPNNKFDFAYDRAALIAISPRRQKRYAEKLTSLIKRHGVLFLVTYDFPFSNSERKNAPYLVTEKAVNRLFGSRFKLLEKECNKAHKFPNAITYLMKKI